MTEHANPNAVGTPTEPLDADRAALQRVRKAWNDAGPFPEYHHDMQEELRRRWSTLANALDALKP